MAPLVLWTYDWVPKGPRGHVRDLRVRWALEEAGLPYEVRSTPFDPRGPEHLAMQPFAQIPMLQEGDISLFESGAILLHLASKSETLMPRDARGAADTLQWVIAALNSVEMVTVPWWFIKTPDENENPLSGWMTKRFESLEPVLEKRQWLAAEQFTIADILMSDILRMPMKKGALEDFPALRAHVERACARPAFKKAHADQMAHFAATDKIREHDQ